MVAQVVVGGCGALVEVLLVVKSGGGSFHALRVVVVTVRFWLPWFVEVGVLILFEIVVLLSGADGGSGDGSGGVGGGGCLVATD